MSELPQPVLRKNDKQATLLIIVSSFVVFAAVSFLTQVKFNINPGFNVHIFALINAIINSVIVLLLLIALIAVKSKNYILHKRIMIAALILSVIFLVSYITHHLLAGEALYGDANHDGVLSDAEKLAVSGSRPVYLVILLSHIFLAAIILPFILFTAYRALIAEYPTHKKLAHFTWPLWFYVAVTGPLVYWMIHPYYR
jgi:putative membrane protein